MAAEVQLNPGNKTGSNVRAQGSQTALENLVKRLDQRGVKLESINREAAQTRANEPHRMIDVVSLVTVRDRPSDDECNRGKDWEMPFYGYHPEGHAFFKEVPLTEVRQA